MTTRTETAAYEPHDTAPRDARDTDRTMPLATVRTLAASAHVGDLVFIRVPAGAQRDAAGTTGPAGAWANRCGIVVDTSGDEPLIAESAALAWTKLSPLSRFVARTAGGRIALARRIAAPTADAQRQVHAAAEQRIDALLGNRFNLRVRRGFCARYVSDVLGMNQAATPAALLRCGALTLEFDGIVFDPGRR
ncbi:YiiX/YebB-like N1pC/P60 family cysteine hydrolase [Burkholderia arboris]|uniref:YiiX/YebB-like N1pC/P60 family cysteine hydrolase n=1 Tax=Burkholderia arboris TaxID=488730 RepID=UPI00210C7E77|nr:YiiX/YebB-like N1pC/P60 family cysteine hydrolase [Burkholderia arboris]UTV57738.1 YiiX/YebB-like N1pC/P60 family cysteine hydrolase [Burkholderia arboris]